MLFGRIDICHEILEKITLYAACRDGPSQSPDEWSSQNATLCQVGLVSSEWNAVSNRILYGDLRVVWRAGTAARLWDTLILRGQGAIVRRISVRFTQLLELVESAQGGNAFNSIGDYQAAITAIRQSSDGPWLVSQGGPAWATLALFGLVSLLPNVTDLHIDQFLDTLPAHIIPFLPLYSLQHIRTLDCQETSRQLLEDLLPRLTQLGTLTFDFHYEDEAADGWSTDDEEYEDEDDEAEYTPAPVDGNPPAHFTPSLHTLRTGFDGGRLTNYLSTHLSTSSITNLSLGPSTVRDLATLPQRNTFPSIQSLRLDAGGDCQQVNLHTLSPILATLFPSITHLALEGFEMSQLDLPSLPTSLDSLEVRLGGQADDHVTDVVSLAKSLSNVGKAHKRFHVTTVLDVDGSAAGCQELEQVVWDMSREGVQVDFKFA